jgi:hypothetical protein
VTCSVAVDDRIYEAVVSALGPAATLDLTVLIGAYNMVSRFVVALEVGRA